MNSDEVGGLPHPFSYAMPPFDPARARRPSCFVGIPEDFLLLIGHVIGAWSQFDISFNRLLGKIMDAHNERPKHWEMESFKKRSSLFLRICRQHFASHPALLTLVEGLVVDAMRLQTDRNLIAHGHILIKIQTFGVEDNQIQGSLFLHCAGQQTGKKLVREYSLDELTCVRYDFAYLCGRMDALSNGKNLHLLHLLTSDIQALQLVLSAGIGQGLT